MLLTTSCKIASTYTLFKFSDSNFSLSFHSNMALSPTFIFLLLVFSLGTTCVPFNAADSTGLEFLKVPPLEFVGSVKTVRNVLQSVTFTLKNHGFFNNRAIAFDDPRLPNAVSTCLDLLDLSDYVLSWSVSAVNDSPQERINNGTGNMSSDLRAWLGAALAYTDTCMDGFEGTRGNVKSLISKKIDQVNSMVQNLLTKVHPVSVTEDNFSTNQGQFPSWVKPADEKLLQENVGHVDAIVAVDGSGNFTKVMDAVENAPDYSLQRYVIYVKKGVYYENVTIDKHKWNLVVIGDGMDSTVISWNLSYNHALNLTTFDTATFGVNGKGFIAKDISFRNTAGPEMHQAVALRSDSDLSVFYRCGIFGYQDSLYAHAMRQFYRECKIAGTVDFICGHGSAVFQKCQILVKKGLPNQKNTITAQSETSSDRPSAFTIQFCNISADDDLLSYVNSTETYLGRPWKSYSTTMIMQSYISDVLTPKGWLEWNGTQYLDTLYYAEYNNFGPGAGLTSNRVKWPGYHVMNDSRQAVNFTVAQLILGNLWLPSTGVMYTPGFGD